MSTSDETQRGTSGARTTTSPRGGSGAGTGPDPADGSGTRQRTETPTAPTAAQKSAQKSAQKPAKKAAPTAAQKTAPTSAPTSKQSAPKPTGKPAGSPGPGSPASAAAASSAAAAARPAAPRRVRLTVARLDPWSVMKLSFLLSVALGIAFVVASGVLWSILDGMGVYTDVSRVVGEIIGDGSFDLTVWAGFGRTLSLVTVLAVVNVVLLTAIFTLGAFLYNISAALVGGLHVTLSDD